MTTTVVELLVGTAAGDKLEGEVVETLLLDKTVDDEDEGTITTMELVEGRAVLVGTTELDAV